jgi:hypothetical protein
VVLIKVSTLAALPLTAVMESVVEASPGLSCGSVMALPAATTLPASVAAVSKTSVLAGLTCEGSAVPVAVTVTCWVELVMPSLTVMS